ncbi:5-hydroxyisourate hydrolase, partial [Globisporangium splendens]
MNGGMSFPFVEHYGNPNGSSNNSPKIVSGVPLTSWKHDSKATRCGICIKKFNILRRRHHCRASFDPPYESRMRRTKSGTFLTQATSDFGSPTSAPCSPCSFASALTPCGSPRAWEAECKVIVSQYRNQKLHSVCSMLGDYLECKGGAIVLANDQHIWVIAHKGLRTSVLHSDTFLSICHNAIVGREPFSVSKPKRSAGQQHCEAGDHNAFHFFSAAPIFRPGRQSPPMGCIIALDTHPRDDTSARKVEKTIQNLAQLVINLLVREKTILHIFSSGDFKVFASNGLDLAPSNSTLFEEFGVAPSPKTASSSAPASSSKMSRSRSFAMGDEHTSFFSRCADSGLCPVTASPRDFDRANREHAASNPEKKKNVPSSAPRQWKNDSTLRAA